MASRTARISLFMANKALLERILMHEVHTLVHSPHYSISSMLGEWLTTLAAIDGEGFIS